MTSSAPRNVASRAIVIVRLRGERPAPVATAVNSAMRIIAIRSSTTRMPNTISRSLPCTPASSNALAMMVVLEIARSHP